MKPGNLGLDTYLVEDCCFAVALRDYVGRLGTADEVHAMSLANLDGDRVVKGDRLRGDPAEQAFWGKSRAAGDPQRAAV